VDGKEDSLAVSAQRKAPVLKNFGCKKIEGATAAGLLALRVLRPLIDP